MFFSGVLFLMVAFHPAACLLVWLFFAVCAQFMGWHGLAICILITTLSAGLPTLQRWLKLIWRAKWLLATLSIILAYGTPGDLWRGLEWAPSVEGIEMAGLHVLRLLALLASLAWLFERLPHRQFLAGLWVLFVPMRIAGLDVDRTVARMALVFDYLEHAPRKGSWQHFLEETPEGKAVIEEVKLEIPVWKTRDSVFFSGILIVMIFLLCLP